MLRQVHIGGSVGFGIAGVKERVQHRLTKDAVGDGSRRACWGNEGSHLCGGSFVEPLESFRSYYDFVWGARGIGFPVSTSGTDTTKYAIVGCSGLRWNNMYISWCLRDIADGGDVAVRSPRRVWRD